MSPDEQWPNNANDKRDERLTAAESMYLESRPEEDGDQGEAPAKRPKKKKNNLNRVLSEMKPDTDLQRPNISFRQILGGDILQSRWLRHQAGLIVLIIVLAIIYIANRYSSQQEMIEIESLNFKLTDAKYNALTRSSELLEKTRRSKIEEYLKARNDSMLQTATVPPYVIEIDDD